MTLNSKFRKFKIVPPSTRVGERGEGQAPKSWRFFLERRSKGENALHVNAVQAVICLAKQNKREDILKVMPFLFVTWL